METTISRCTSLNYYATAVKFIGQNSKRQNINEYMCHHELYVSVVNDLEISCLPFLPFIVLS